MKKNLSPMFAALAVAATFAVALPAQAQGVAGDAKAGEGKVAMCIGCHGIVGYKSAHPEKPSRCARVIAVQILCV